MSRGRPSARSTELAATVLDAMREHIDTDTALAAVLGVAQPVPARARRLGLTPAVARQWCERWTASGRPAMAVRVVVEVNGKAVEVE